MAEAYAWVRIATAKQLQQLGMDETKINGILHLGAVNVLVDGTSEGVRHHIENGSSVGRSSLCSCVRS